MSFAVQAQDEAPAVLTAQPVQTSEDGLRRRGTLGQPAEEARRWWALPHIMTSGSPVSGHLPLAVDDDGLVPFGRPELGGLRFQTYGRPARDIFASSLIRRLLPLCEGLSPTGVGDGRLVFQWDGLFAYASPPWCLRQQVRLRLRGSRRSDLSSPLLAEARFPILLSLLCDSPFQFTAREAFWHSRGAGSWFYSPSRLHLS